MDTSSTRYLPTYEDAIMSYSLRLPTYRSSYIRRYHPYARYTTPIVQEPFMDEIDYDEPILDLTLLDRRVEPVRVEPTTIEDVNHLPEHLEDTPDVPTAGAQTINVNNGEQEELHERADQNIVFIRVDIKLLDGGAA